MPIEISFEDLYERFKSLTRKLTKREKNYIHYNSFNNFFKHYKDIQSLSARQDIYRLLSNYINILESNNFKDLDRTFAVSITESHLFKIGKIYKENLGFKEIISPKLMFLASACIDLILFLFKTTLSSGVPIPIVTILVTVYFFLHLNRFLKQQKVYGVFW